MSGSTNVSDLNKNGVHLWDIWATEEICSDLNLPKGELGPIYGKQWREYDGANGKMVDQIKVLVDGLRNNPDSRRHIVTAWNPSQIDDVFVAPCHCLFQAFHAQGELSLHLFQRSADAPIGVPFNIAEYSLLLLMLAQVCGLKPKEFIHTLGDVHIYKNQIEEVKTQLKRNRRQLPKVVLNPTVTDIFDFRFEDFSLLNYDPHPAIKIPVSL